MPPSTRPNRAGYTIGRVILDTFILLIALTAATTAHAQWEPDVRLTTATYQSFTPQTNQQGIVSSGDTLHIVWYDFRGQVWDVYYKRSTDGGTTWGEDIAITNDTNRAFDPCIAVSGSHVHITWDDFTTEVRQVGYKRSTDGGTTWGTPSLLTQRTTRASTGAIAAEGSNVHLAYQDDRDGGRQIYYMRSSDHGENWSAETAISTGTAGDTAFAPAIAVSGENVHLLWVRLGPVMEYHHRRSTDGGNTWQPETIIATDTLPMGMSIAQYFAQSISAAGTAVDVAWHSYRSGVWELYYKRSSDAGATWRNEQRLTNGDGAANWSVLNPKVTGTGSDVHIAWTDFRHQNQEIYYRRSTDGGTTWSEDMRLTNDLELSSRPFILVSGPSLHVVWSDTRDNNTFGEIYYKRNRNFALSANDPRHDDVQQSFGAVISPNPFGTGTTIRFELAASGMTTVSIHDELGNEVALLLDEQLKKGIHRTTWEGRCSDGSAAASGRYYYSIVSQGRSETGSLLLVR